MARKLPFWEESPCKWLDLGKAGDLEARFFIRSAGSQKPFVGGTDKTDGPQSVRFSARRYRPSHRVSFVDTRDGPLASCLWADAGLGTWISRCKENTDECTKLNTSHLSVFCTPLIPTAIQYRGDHCIVGAVTQLPHFYACL